MIDLLTVRTLLEYTDWSNHRLLECAGPLTDEQLDRDMQIGPGSLRKTMLHIYNGESVWLKRWRSEIEIKWPSEAEKVSITDLTRRFEGTIRERDMFLERVPAANLSRVQTYRDSKGSLFQASLGDMLIQGVMHSKHHQAQACNILRRLGAEWPELDYMYRIRQSV